MVPKSLRDSGMATVGRRGALASIERQGFTGEDGIRSASTELGHRGRGGALASIKRQGFTGEDGTRSASTEFARRGGVVKWGDSCKARINMKSGSCIYPGCPYSISSGKFCKNHQPQKPIVEKSDKCKDCGRVFVAKERVRGGVCNSCYQKPETVAIRKKAMAAKKDTLGTCSTPGCNRVNERGRGKCCACLYPKSK